jgi:hypothetical protein
MRVSQNHNNSKNLRLISEAPSSKLPLETSGHMFIESQPLPEDIAKMVQNCDSLPPEIRDQILALISQAK